MVKMSEGRLAQAERFVRENERRITKHALVERLETDGHAVPAMQARKLLATFRSMNAVARDHLRIEREKRGVVI
jgi:hypothetical protein